MNVKKMKLVSAMLLGMGVLSVTQIYASGMNKGSLKINKVYSAYVRDTAEQSIEVQDVDQELKDYYITQSKDLLRRYFGVVPDSKLQEGFNLISKESIAKEKEEWDSAVNKYYEDKKIDKEKRDDYLKRNDEIAQNQYNKLNKMGHDYVECSFKTGGSGSSVEVSYDLVFNANTKELMDLCNYSAMNLGSKPKANEKELEKVGEEFVKQFSLAGIQTPKVLKFQSNINANIAYADANDPSKKVAIDINPTTKKVFGISFDYYADSTFE